MHPLRLPAPLLAVSISAGCMPYSTLHSPKTLARGERVLGASVAVPSFLVSQNEPWSSFVGFSTLVGRFGVADRVDAGFRVGIWEGASADVMYELVRGPVSVSADLAVSAIAARRGLGVHPLLLVGTEQVYGGAKLLSYPLVDNAEPALFGLILGASLGRRTRVVPEVTFYRETEPDGYKDSFVYVALGIQRFFPVKGRLP